MAVGSSTNCAISAKDCCEISSRSLALPCCRHAASRSSKRMNGCHKLQSVAAVQPPNLIESACSLCQRCCRKVNNWRKTCIEHASTLGTKPLIETRLRTRTCCSLTRWFCTYPTSVSDDLLLRLSWLSRLKTQQVVSVVWVVSCDAVNDLGAGVENAYNARWCPRGLFLAALQVLDHFVTRL